MSGGLMRLEQAIDALLADAEREPRLDSQSVPLAEAEGRILAEPLVAGMDLPPWPNSAMDGYALRLADAGGEPLPVTQKVFAGREPLPLAPGSCARIFTGAPLPSGADVVEMQENVDVLDDGRVRFREPLKAGRHIRPQGDEVRRGEEVLAAGARLGPVELGLAASLGITQVAVVRRLRVGLLSTGDELLEPGQPLLPGRIYNSNRYLLRAWLQRLGCEVQDAGVLPDDPDRIRERLASLQDQDLLLTTGGVSVGEADHLGRILREGGEPTLWKLALKPGKPLTCARYGRVPVIGLPGNPGSALVTFGLLARPYLLRRQGMSDIAPLGIAVPAGFDWPVAGKRREFLQGRVQDGQAIPHGNRSSAVLRSAAWAEGLIEIPEEQAFARGTLLRFIPYSELLG